MILVVGSLILVRAPIRRLGSLLLYLLFLSACIFNPSADGQRAPAAPSLEFADTGELRNFFHWQPGKPPLISAHRGGPEPGFPENCLATLEHTLEIAPAILEIDVSMTKDSVLVLMHDNTLDRTTTGFGPVEAKTWAELQSLWLVDNDGRQTGFRIPTLEETLRWSKGRSAILSLDVKRGVPFERVVQAVEANGMRAGVMIIVYNHEDARQVYRLDPELLMSVSLRNDEEIDRFLNTGVPPENVVAFTGTILKEAAFYERLHELGISCILGTLGNLDKSVEARGDELYREFRERGVDIFATDRPRAVGGVFYGKN